MKFMYKGRIFESTTRRSLAEVYSENNSALLKYAKQDGIDLGEYPYSEFFHDWMYDHDEEALRDFEDEHSWDDIDEVKSAFPEQLKAFEDAVNNGKYSNEIDIHGKTKVNMSLQKKQLLPRTTWLIHFSDSVDQIAMQGFKYGAEDMTDMALTKNSRGPQYPGYNFAFIAGSKYASNAAMNPGSGYRDSAGKYGKDAVMFMNSGVHFYHYGDEEDQIVFYGPEANDFVLIKYVDGKYVIEGNQSYKGHEYLFTPQEDGRRSFDVCVDWVKKNWTQYKNVMAYHVNTKKEPIDEGVLSSILSAGADGVLKGMGFGEVPGQSLESLPVNKDKNDASKK